MAEPRVLGEEGRPEGTEGPDVAPTASVPAGDGEVGSIGAEPMKSRSEVKIKVYCPQYLLYKIKSL